MIYVAIGLLFVPAFFESLPFLMAWWLRAMIKANKL